MYKKRRDAMHCVSTGGGERGIRTPGGVTLNGFQDRRIRPLCHLSFAGAKVHFFFKLTKATMKIITEY